MARRISDVLRPVAIALALSLALPISGPFAARAAEPSSQPSQEQKQIADAVGKLASADPAERDEATRTLWAAGETAKAALVEAAAGDDVEVARRAKEILRNLRLGIRPDTPRSIVDLLNLYRGDDRAGVQAAVAGLAGGGNVGVRILTRLWQEEQEPWRKALLARRLAERSRTAAALLLSEGSAGAVLPLLEAAADAPSVAGEQALRDLAAYLLVRDKAALDERVGRLKPLVSGAPPDAGANANAGAKPAPPTTVAKARAAALLTYLCRARNDMPAARWAAEQSGDATLLEGVLIEAADWKAMAERSAARLDAPPAGPAAQGAPPAGAAPSDPPSAETLENLAYAAAYHRMAGDDAGAKKFSDRIVDYADKRPDDNWLAAEALILNDRPDDGIAVLVKHRNYPAAAELLAPRMQFEELFKLAGAARENKPTEAPKVEARAAATRHFLGDAKAAKESLDRLLETNQRDRDFELYAALAEAAGDTHQAQLAEECVVLALNIVRPMDDVSGLLEQAGLRPGERAWRWWNFLRTRYKEPVRLTFGRLRSLLRGELPAAQVEALAHAAGEEAIRHGTGTADRDAWLLEIGQTLVALDQREAARNFFKRLNSAPAAPNPVPVAFLRLGDFEAEDGQWDRAATLYGRAWEMDKSRPLPLLLRGNALTRIGRQKEGRELIEQAHLMPLADEAMRHELMVELDKRKLGDEARRERGLIVRTAGFSSWYLGDTLRRLGDETYEKGEYAAAAALWDRAFLDNQSRSTRFAEPWANFAMPSLVHRARALGLMRTGDLEAATREADLAMRYTPGDADAVIAFVNELDRLGKKAEADAMYQRHTAAYRALCEKYPASGQLHNQLAWAEAKCRRDPDDALKNATRAVELEPDNTASLDTLAEAHYQRGEYQKAIEAINRCIELEPKEKRHAEQLERFRKAMVGK